MKTKYLAAGIIMTAMTAMTSCSDDDNKGLDPNLPLYQQYRVEQMMWDNTVTAFANFEASKDGKTTRVHLDNGASIRANNTLLTYYESDVSDPYSFDYASDISLPADKKVTFTFVRNSETTLTNIIDLTAVPYVTIPDSIKVISNGKRYELPVVGHDLQGTFQVMLSENGVIPANTYQASSIFFSGDKLFFSFSGVPAGRKYDLRVLCATKRSLQQTNGSQGGEIVGCKVSRKLNIDVR